MGSWKYWQAHTIIRATTLQTPADAETTIDSFTLLDENTYNVKATILGIKADGSQRAGYFLSGTVYRTGAGNATIEGQTGIESSESDAAWNAAFTVSGNVLRVSVTGVAATVINWRCKLEIFK